MSNLPKIEPDHRKCPVCEALKIPDVPAKNHIAFGIVLRDVVPMETLAAIICDEHTALLLHYYDIMIALSVAYNGQPIPNPVDVKLPPPKDMN